MAILIDTSVLARLANANDAHYVMADRAVTELHRRGERLCITARNMVEFRSVATRAAALNGLGLSTVEAESKAAKFELQFSRVEETPDIFPAWKALVAALAFIGKQVHDARLVAICQVNQVSHLLTFNVAHFSRLTTFGPSLCLLHPATVQSVR